MAGALDIFLPDGADIGTAAGRAAGTKAANGAAIDTNGSGIAGMTPE